MNGEKEGGWETLIVPLGTQSRELGLEKKMANRDSWKTGKIQGKTHQTKNKVTTKFSGSKPVSRLTLTHTGWIEKSNYQKIPHQTQWKSKIIRERLKTRLYRQTSSRRDHYLFVYYLQILKFDDEISFPLQIHNHSNSFLPCLFVCLLFTNFEISFLLQIHNLMYTELTYCYKCIQIQVFIL